jgi:hypothetical protein
MEPEDVVYYAVFEQHASILDNPYLEGTVQYDKFEEEFKSLVNWLEFIGSPKDPYIKEQKHLINQCELKKLANDK